MGIVKAATWKPSPDLERRMESLRPVFEKVAGESGLPVQLLQAIAIVESNMDPVAENPESGAKGLMQIMPLHYGETYDLPHGPSVTFREDNWTVPIVNVRTGAGILLDYGAGDRDTKWWNVLNRYNGDLPPRDAEYEDDVQSIYAAMLRRRTFGW